MKRVISVVLMLGVLLQLWGCRSSTVGGDISSSVDSSTVSQGMNSTLQEKENGVSDESILESVAMTVLSDNETVAYVDEYIQYLTEFIKIYTDFLDDTNDSISYADIGKAETFWKEKLPETNEKLTQIKTISFPDKYKNEYDTICNITEVLHTVAEDLTKWDTNGDGAYTDDEINILIHSCSDSLRGLSAEVEKLRPILENDTANEEDDSFSLNDIDTNSSKENEDKLAQFLSKKCNICGKTIAETRLYEMKHIGGETKYYCSEHYKDMGGTINNSLSPVESSNDSTHAATLGEKNALKSAKAYLDYTAFSYTGLIEQLEYEGYSHTEAVYGADNCGADWNEQAAKSAANYLDYTSFSRSGLIEQLEYEGFTHSQAVYGVEQNGY